MFLSDPEAWWNCLLSEQTDGPPISWCCDVGHKSPHGAGKVLFHMQEWSVQGRGTVCVTWQVWLHSSGHCNPLPFVQSPDVPSLHRGSTSHNPWCSWALQSSSEGFVKWLQTHDPAFKFPAGVDLTPYPCCLPSFPVRGGSVRSLRQMRHMGEVPCMSLFP